MVAAARRAEEGFAMAPKIVQNAERELRRAHRRPLIED
jgi:hypothetical protein